MKYFYGPRAREIHAAGPGALSPNAKNAGSSQGRGTRPIQARLIQKEECPG